MVEVIATAQSKGLISGNKDYLEQLTNFALKGELPTKRNENSTFSFLADVNKVLKERLLADFKKLESFVEEDKEKIFKVDIGNGQSEVRDLRELEPQPE